MHEPHPADAHDDYGEYSPRELAAIEAKKQDTARRHREALDKAYASLSPNDVLYGDTSKPIPIEELERAIYTYLEHAHVKCS